MIGIPFEFDISAITYFRPTCLVCGSVIDKGIAYVRTPIPANDYYCMDHAPDWMKRAAEKIREILKPGECIPSPSGRGQG
ncbi:MAG: hypothetical protein M1469_01115 [Bacteroidetes bacterium]|nr:hypothetical protein [Bacteroidota bacterium]